MLTPGLKGIRLIQDLELEARRVFIRCDFNVPMEKGGISDDRRIQAALPTIRYAMQKGAKIVLASHFGRPEKKEDHAKYSLEPVGRRLGELLDCEVILTESPSSEAPKGLLPGLRSNQVILLENLRFDEGEVENSPQLATRISHYTDVYINDAFGASHRAHASIDALARLIKNHGAGFLIEKEIAALDSLVENPVKPYVVILGGAKVSDKIPLIENMIEKADTFIIGGAMAYTFLHASGVSVGASRVEKDKVSFAREMMGRISARKKKILLPIDHICAERFENPQNISTTSTAAIGDGFLGLDIGPQTLALFAAEISRAKTVFWNGPMGVFENQKFSTGTFGIAKALASISATAKTIVGGGDSASAAEASGYAEQMTHISTGGGASLEYLQGTKLPGLEALRDK
jgi:phosphoglycerate kinase